VKSFGIEAFAASDARVLILGTLPGAYEVSATKNRYSHLHIRHCSRRRQRSGYMAGSRAGGHERRVRTEADGGTG